jgi:predicted secreted protein
MSLPFFFFTWLNLWWLTLFAVLPWGVKRAENPDPLHASGAPEKTHLGLKLAATTGISLLLACAAKIVVDSGILAQWP